MSFNCLHCQQVASMKCGFLPVSQESVLVGHVSYHDFYGVLVDKAERELIIKNLGNNNVLSYILYFNSSTPLSIISIFL